MPRLDESLISDLMSSKLTRFEFLKIIPTDIEKNTESPTQSIWRAVITQALMDAGSNSKKIEARQEKARAIAWLHSDSQDFYQVCEFADFEPEYIKKCAKKALARNCIWRKTNKIKTEKVLKIKSKRGRKKISIEESLLRRNFI